MITKAALLLFRETHGIKELLFVRAYNNTYFIFPGGKQEPHEIIQDTLRRELQEELHVAASNIQELGMIEGKTPDGRPLRMNLFSSEIVGNPKPSAEIKEIFWMSQKTILENLENMTPMTIDHVLPFLDKQGLW